MDGGAPRPSRDLCPGGFGCEIAPFGSPEALSGVATALLGSSGGLPCPLSLGRDRLTRVREGCPLRACWLLFCPTATPSQWDSGGRRGRRQPVSPHLRAVPCAGAVTDLGWARRGGPRRVPGPTEELGSCVAPFLGQESHLCALELAGEPHFSVAPRDSSWGPRPPLLQAPGPTTGPSAGRTPPLTASAPNSLLPCSPFAVVAQLCRGHENVHS